jgi:hypothetical protein
MPSCHARHYRSSNTTDLLADFDRFAWLMNSIARFKELDGIENWLMIGIDVSPRTMFNIGLFFR